MQQDVLPAVQARRPAGHLQVLIQAMPVLGLGHGLRVEIDVIADEKIQPAVAVVIEKRAAGVPAVQARGSLARGFRDACFLAHVGERAVAVVMVEHAIAPIGDEQVVQAVVIVIADAAALAPASARHAGFDRHVGERAVAIILEQAAHRSVVLGPIGLKACAVHEENIQPAVMIVVVERHAAAGGFQQIAVVALGSENGFYT